MLLQRTESPPQQALGDVFVVARNNDRDVEVSTAQVRLLASFTHSSTRLQQMTQLVFLGLQVPLAVGVRGGVDRHPLDHLEPEALEAIDLLWVVGKQPDLAHAEVVQDLTADTVIALVCRMSECFVGLDGIQSAILEVVGVQLVQQPYPTSLLVSYVQNHTNALG